MKREMSKAQQINKSVQLDQRPCGPEFILAWSTSVTLSLEMYHAEGCVEGRETSLSIFLPSQAHVVICWQLGANRHDQIQAYFPTKAHAVTRE